MSEIGPARLSKTALAAFVLGLSSPLLSLLAALPALYVGLRAIRNINAAEGQLRGRGLAIAGLILGGLTTLATALGIAAWILLLAQGKSHLAGCSNNLRLIGQAVHRYSDKENGHFPSATVPNELLAPPQRLSWDAAILPYLAEGTPAGKRWGQMASEIDFEKAWDAEVNAAPRQKNVPAFLCPAFANDLSPPQRGLTAYAGIAGVGADAADLPVSDPRAGFFGYERRPTRADITSGLSTTMMVAETQQDNGPWLAGGTPTVRSLDSEAERYIGRGRPFGGLHREGLNVLWADGSVRLLNEDVAPHVFRADARINRTNED